MLAACTHPHPCKYRHLHPQLYTFISNLTLYLVVIYEGDPYHYELCVQSVQ